MHMPGFTAEVSLSSVQERYHALAPRPPESQAVIPQFCYCDCRLYQFCIPLPPYGIPFCYYREFCIPRGHCPPGYCRTG
jgi:hypothetical protein